MPTSAATGAPSCRASDVNALCLTPKLRFLVWEFEGHFGRKVIMNSGYRDGNHNAQAGGADNSYHTRVHGGGFLHSGRRTSGT